MIRQVQVNSILTSSVQTHSPVMPNVQKDMVDAYRKKQLAK